jgi:hypothetical protein
MMRWWRSAGGRAAGAGGGAPSSESGKWGRVDFQAGSMKRKRQIPPSPFFLSRTLSPARAPPPPSPIRPSGTRTPSVTAAAGMSAPPPPPAPSSSTLAVHRCRFLDTAAPSGVVTLALHPASTWAAVSRENGSVELWATHGAAAGSSHGAPAAPSAPASDSASSSSSSAPSSSSSAPSLPSSWVLVATIPGTAATAAPRSLAWAPLKSRAVPGIDGARCFASSLDGRVYECDWATGLLRPAADSHGGGVWAIAAYDVQRAGGSPSSGCLLAAGCEDGSVRLLRVSTHARELEHVAACRGAEARVLSLAWHPTLPVLFAGTAAGTVRGWDLSAVVRGLIDVHEAAQVERTAAAARAKAKAKAKAEKERARQQQQRDGGAVSSSDSDDDSSDDDDDDEDMPSAAAAAAAAALASSSGSRAATAPQALVRMQLDAVTVGRRGAAAAPVPRSIWSLAVLRDLTVLSADSKGEVNAWDGRTGTLSSSVPLIRADGDLLSLAVAEDASGVVTLAAGGADARVFVATRAAAAPPTGGASSSSAPARRWVLVGNHTAHASDVRCVAVGMGGPAAASAWVVSGAADAQLAVVRATAVTTASPPPRFVYAFGQGPRLLGVAAQGRMLASFQDAAVQVFTLPAGNVTATAAPAPAASSSSAAAAAPTPSKKGKGSSSSGAAAADAAAALAVAVTPPSDLPPLLLQIDAPCVPGTRGAASASATDAATVVPVPEAQPSALAMSPSGQWLCYATGGKRAPHLVHLHLAGGAAAGDVSGATPSHVELPERLVALIESSSQGGTVSRLALVGSSSSPSSSASDAVFLLAVAGGKVHVCLCTLEAPPSPLSNPSPAPGSGKKRARDSSAAAGHAAPSPTCTFLYSLPLPHGHTDPVLIPASAAASARFDAKGAGRGAAGGRARSATLESGGLESVVTGGDGDVDDDDDDDGEVGARRGGAGAAASAARPGSAGKQGGGAGVGIAAGGRGGGNAGGGAPGGGGGGGGGGGTNVAVLPLLLEATAFTAAEGSAGTAVLAAALGGGSGRVAAVAALATSTRHVHVYALGKSAGALLLTLPRLPSLPTALAFAPNASALLVALRDGTVSAFDPATGRLAPWSPPPGDRSKITPKQAAARLAGDPLRSLLVATAAVGGSGSGSGGVGAAVKVIGFGVETTASLTFTGGGAAGPAGVPVSVVAAVSDKYTNVAAAFGPLGTGAGKAPAAAGKGAKGALVTEAVVVEVPWRRYAEKILPPTVARRKYGS